MSMPGNGKTVGGIIDAFKGNPMLLAVLLTNVMLLIFVFYNERQHVERADRVGKVVQALFERCITIGAPKPQP